MGFLFSPYTCLHRQNLHTYTSQFVVKNILLYSRYSLNTGNLKAPLGHYGVNGLPEAYLPKYPVRGVLKCREAGKWFTSVLWVGNAHN